MTQKLKLITAPASEPVSLAEAKQQLRVDTTTEDTLIEALITAARKQVEAESLSALITQTWDVFMDAFPGVTRLELPLPPLQSVTGIYYTPYSTGVEATWSSSYYLVDTYSSPGAIVLKRTSSWPSEDLIDVNGARIRFVAGYGANGGLVDQRLRQAILLLTGYYYDNREAVMSAPGVVVTEMPLGVRYLIDDVRMQVRRF